MMEDPLGMVLGGTEEESGLPAEVRAIRSARASMYGPSRESEGDIRDVDALLAPVDVVSSLAPNPSTHRAGSTGLSGSALEFARKHPKDASALLEWAASATQQSQLSVTFKGLEGVEITVPYVKLEAIGPSLTFFLSPATPPVKIGFSTAVLLKFEGREEEAVAAVAGEAGPGNFPYARLEFFLEKA